jgi:hypothetical protein
MCDICLFGCVYVCMCVCMCVCVCACVYVCVRVCPPGVGLVDARVVCYALEAVAASRDRPTPCALAGDDDHRLSLLCSVLLGYPADALHTPTIAAAAAAATVPGSLDVRTTRDALAARQLTAAVDASAFWAARAPVLEVHYRERARLSSTVPGC